MAMRTHVGSHEQFDAICAQVGEFEPLPTMSVDPLEVDGEHKDEDEGREPLNELILAGLVSP